MKALFIGIFIIIALGLLFFTIQLVKSPQFKDSLTLSPSKFASETDSGVGSKTKTFVDINNNFLLVLPDEWELVAPGKVHGLAPLVQAEVGKYVMVSTGLIPRKENMNVDIESLTTNLPKSMVDAISALAGEDMNIQVDSVKKTTFKNGVNGFKLAYQGKTDGDVLVYRYVKGNMYAYYVRGEILYAFTLQIASEKSAFEHTSGTRATSFLQKGDIVLQELSIF
jgi:hypothetical protein